MDELACDVECVCTELRRGDVRALSVDADGEVVDGGIVAAGAQPHGAGRQIRRRVQAEDAVRAVEHVRGDERARALADLLGGLEEEAHLTAEVRAVCAQHLRRAD